MNIGEWISRLPLWSVFVLTFAICLGAVEAGAALARFAVRWSKETEPEAPLGSLVGAVLGLLAFILAFTFGITASRFDARKQLVLEEANGSSRILVGPMPCTPGSFGGSFGAVSSSAADFQGIHSGVQGALELLSVDRIL